MIDIDSQETLKKSELRYSYTFIYHVIFGAGSTVAPFEKVKLFAPRLEESSVASKLTDALGASNCVVEATNFYLRKAGTGGRKS